MPRIVNEAKPFFVNEEPRIEQDALIFKKKMNVIWINMCLRRETYSGVGVKESARLGWVVDSAPTDLQIGPTNGGVISTTLPIKLPSLASPLRPKGRVCEEQMLRCSQIRQAWFDLQRQKTHRWRGWGPQCSNYPRNVTMVLLW